MPSSSSLTSFPCVDMNASAAASASSEFSYSPSSYESPSLISKTEPKAPPVDEISNLPVHLGSLLPLNGSVPSLLLSINIADRHTSKQANGRLHTSCIFCSKKKGTLSDAFVHSSKYCQFHPFNSSDRSRSARNPPCRIANHRPCTDVRASSLRKIPLPCRPRPDGTGLS